MKALFEPLRAAAGASFLVRRFAEKAFSAPYHFHPEYELTLILQGEGKRFVGSSMEAYDAGDLVLLGANLPHCWKSEKGKGRINAQSVVVQFASDFLGADFFSKTEAASVRQLLERSRFGIKFPENVALTVKEDLLKLEDEQEPFGRLLLLLQILHRLSKAKPYRLLDKQQKQFPHAPAEQKRINDVLAFVVENFQQEIVLEKAAAVAGLTPTAFCKYFKRTTRKTFMETVLDYRLNHAVHQLVQTDKGVAGIAFESGFGDVSHFFKKFKSRYGISPLAYRKNFAKEIA